jgi:hypothetical protein
MQQRKTKMSLQPGNIDFDEGLTQAPNLNRTIDSTGPDEPTSADVWIYFIWGGLFLCLCMCCIKAIRSSILRCRMISMQEEKGKLRLKDLTDQFVKSGNQMVRVETPTYSEESNLLTRPPLLVDIECRK